MSPEEREELQHEVDSCNVASTPQCIEEDHPPMLANPSEADDDGGVMKENSREEAV